MKLRPTKRLLEEISSYIDEHFVASEGTVANESVAVGKSFTAGEEAVACESIASDENIVVYEGVVTGESFAADEGISSLAEDEDFDASEPMPRASAPAFETRAADAPAAKSRMASASSSASHETYMPFAAAESIDELLNRKEATFSEALLQEIDARNLRDPEVYKHANIDRKLFSKIRSNAQYQPKKQTAIALALALSMNLDDTLDLIGRAGYTLTASSKADLIVQYFIEHSCWDINLINQVLYEFDQPLIGC